MYRTRSTPLPATRTKLNPCSVAAGHRKGSAELHTSHGVSWALQAPASCNGLACPKLLNSTLMLYKSHRSLSPAPFSSHVQGLHRPALIKQYKAFKLIQGHGNPNTNIRTDWNARVGGRRKGLQVKECTVGSKHDRLHSFGATPPNGTRNNCFILMVCFKTIKWAALRQLLMTLNCAS